VTADPCTSTTETGRRLATLQVLVLLLFALLAVAATLAWPAAGPAIVVGASVIGVLLLVIRL